MNYNEKPVIFSLEKIQRGKYCLSSQEQEHKAMFADAIFRRKDLTWIEAFKAHKHGLGCEKNPKTSIRTGIPRFITADQNHFLVFRYHGKNPMVGIRRNNIFFVLWFDFDFSLYSH